MNIQVRTYSNNYNPRLDDVISGRDIFNSAPIYFYQKTAAPFTKDDLAKTVTSANLRTMLKAVIVTIRLC